MGSVEVVIVGGGMAGLSAAARLKQHGIQVVDDSLDLSTIVFLANTWIFDSLSEYIANTWRKKSLYRN